ncbi:MAG TPA: hypothetical protein VF518_00620 [Polyangia bacterium]
MSELAELYAIFLALYAFECCTWVPRRSVGVMAMTGRWWLRRAWRPNPGWRVSLVLGTPWPPLTPPFVTEPLPFALGPDGITLWEADGAFVPWGAAGPFRAEGARLEGAGSATITMATRRGAAALAAALEELRQLPAKKRTAAILQLLDSRFDSAEAGDRIAQFKRDVRFLRVCSNLLWVSVFGGLAAVVAVQAAILLLPLAVLVFGFSVLNAVAFARTLRRLSWLQGKLAPDQSKRLVVYLSPISSVRAADLMARELLGDLDPLAAAGALATPSMLAAFVRPQFAALRLQRRTPAPGGEADHDWWRDQVGQRIERMCRQRGLEALLAPPPRESKEVEVYCPSCLAQFGLNRTGDLCPSDGCAEIPLQPYDPVL